MPKGFTGLQIKTSLGTARIMDKIVRLAKPDEFGRRVPNYVLIHRALGEYLDKLIREKETSDAEREPSRAGGSDHPA